MAKRTTDEVVISLKINNKQAAASISELEGDLRLLQNHMKGLNPELDKEQFEKVQKQYGALKDRIIQVKEEVGLLQKKIETPIDPKSLSGLEKKASELKKALSEINPEVDKAKFDKMKAEYEGVQKEITDTKDKLGFVKKAEKEVETGAGQIGEAFKQMATAAFWIAMIQQIYELAKAFFEVQKEINGLQTQIGKMTGKTGAELDQMVGKTQGISKAFDVEAAKVNNAANSIAKNMKISFAEAQELIKKGLAASAETDKGELLDWYEEYASALSNTGIKADEFVATISQMKEQGVWDDFLIDGFKEFGIRASTDLGKIVTAMKTVEKATGTVFAEQMGKDLQTGKISVMDSMRLISTELAKLPADSMIAKNAISEVFGSKGEDLGTGVIQAFSKAKNATDYLSQSSKGYNSQLDSLIESQQTLTATQSELFGKMQSGSKFIDILTNKALTLLYKTLILIVENSQPLVDIWNSLSNTAKNVYTEVHLLLKSFGLAGKEGNLMKYVIEAIAAAMTLSSLPMRLIWNVLVSISEAVRWAYKGFTDLWSSLSSSYPVLEYVGKAFQLYIDYLLFYPRLFAGAISWLDKWLDKNDEVRRQAQETAEFQANFKSEIEEKRAKELKESEESYKKREEKDGYSSEETLKQKREEQVEYTSGQDNSGTVDKSKPDYTAQSQAYQDYLAKQKEAKDKADAEKLKTAEEIAKAQADIDKKLEEAKMAAITDENERKIAQMEAQAQAEIKDFQKTKATTEQKAEFQKLVEAKLFNDISEIRQTALDAKMKMLEEDEKAERAVVESIINAEKERLSIEQERIGLKLTELEQNEKPQSEFEDQSAYLYQKYQLEQEARDLADQQKLLNLELIEEQEFNIKDEYRLANEAAETAHTDAMIGEKMRLASVQVQATQMVFGAMKESTQAIVDLFGEQTEAGKAAAIAMKAFSAGEIVASTIVEIQKIWEFANADATNVVIPGWRYGLAAVQTAGVLARRAKSLAELGSIKFKEGGFLRGRSHDTGGINGTGRFANIQVEGGEYITNKKATSLNLPVLEAINRYGDQVDFSRMIHFATGGQIPNTTPSSAAVEAIRFNDQNLMGESMLRALQEMGQKLDSYEREKQVYVNYSNIESAGDTMATIREY